MAKQKVDAELVQELARLLDENDLTEIEWSEEGRSVRVVRGAAVVTAAPAVAPAPAPIQEQAATATDTVDGDAVHSPMVGTIYVAPEPGAEPFITIGSQVSQGQTLLIVEAMKTMNPIPAPRAGVVAQILVANGDPVEYGQPLLILR